MHARVKRFVTATIALAIAMTSLTAAAETGYDGWLRYAPVDDAAAGRRYAALPATVVALGAEDSQVIGSARGELIRGVRGMLGRTLRIGDAVPADGAIVIGTIDKVREAVPSIGDGPEFIRDGYWIRDASAGGRRIVVVTGPDDRGVLYGTFELLRLISLHEPIAEIDDHQNPYAPIRVLNHWENLNGSIERGYAGRSIFWENGHVREDLSRVEDYARFMASLGINGCSINNVNADARVISEEYLPEVARIAAVFRRWGVQTYISLDFASPRRIGGVESFDPLDEGTVAFWKEAIDRVYAAVPDLGGFIIKADSEGRLGPSEYGRTHADAANVVARAVKPHGGVLFYRGFVYNHRMDWRDLSLDRAKAAYDNFAPLDGLFEDNVIIQIKHGPIDFQVREPASPLFGALPNTNQAIELQITQEYLGQQLHMCYVVPMWKEVLDFDMHAKGAGTPVKQLVAGRTFDRPTGGFVGVSNVGLDANWLGHHLAMANLYGFGRLAWNPDLSAQQIAEEWTRQTFGHDPAVVGTVVGMQMKSWEIYENYTGNLGIGTLTEITGVHYGPGVESSEHNGWGQWHRSVEDGTGMYRTTTGTGYTQQYHEPVASMYDSLETCPDELLLFFHHVPYTHVLHSGKTVIQHMYDAHYLGAEQARWLADSWRALEGRVDEQRYHETLTRLDYQADHAIVWRDAVNRWFHAVSGIDDIHGRVDHYPDRVEAEDMDLSGYEVIEVTPFETASNSHAVQLPRSQESGSVSFTFNGEGGWHDLGVQYFDENDGVSSYRLSINGQVVDEWVGEPAHNGPQPVSKPDGHTSTRRNVRGLALRAGDVIRIDATADGRERAAIDYVRVRPAAP